MIAEIVKETNKPIWKEKEKAGEKGHGSPDDLGRGEEQRDRSIRGVFLWGILGLLIIGADDIGLYLHKKTTPSHLDAVRSMEARRLELLTFRV